MNGICQKILRVQSRLKAPKNQYNKFGGYYFRNCEDIVEAAKPLLNKEGLLMLISDEIIKFGERYYIKAIVTITDGENEKTVTAYAREQESKKGMDMAQITGAASSYARKYALNGIFAIDDSKQDSIPDPDYNSSVSKNNNTVINKERQKIENKIQSILKIYKSNEEKVIPEIINFLRKSGLPANNIKEIYKLDLNQLGVLLNKLIHIR